MQDILKNRQTVYKIIILKDHADLAALFPEFFSFLGGYRLTVQPYRPAADRDQPVDGAQEGRLS